MVIGRCWVLLKKGLDMKIRFLLIVVCFIMVVMLCGCNEQVKLFNGKNLDGWSSYTGYDDSGIWSVKNGNINCKGKPAGYLRTVEEYSNYKLHVEWRWVAEPTNSGILLHCTGEDKIRKGMAWPICIEAQLKHGQAGDFVTIQDGAAITVDGKRYASVEDKPINIIAKQGEDSEKPAGQWNCYDIVCKDDTIEIAVNGQVQNYATQASLTSGSICLQSEGSEIEFRNIVLERLK